MDILPEVVHTIDDALNFFSSPESLEGYRISARKVGVVSARDPIKLQTFPKVLIFHLMCFSFGIAGNGKLHKPIHFSPKIILGCKFLLSLTTKGLRYELVATVTYHGRDPSKGNYTIDTKHFDCQWLWVDHVVVSVVGLNKDCMINHAFYSINRCKSYECNNMLQLLNYGMMVCKITSSMIQIFW